MTAILFMSPWPFEQTVFPPTHGDSTYFNWFRCYHTDMWQQAQDIVSLVLIGLLIFWNSQSDAALHKFCISENKQSVFFIKSQYLIISYLLKTIL